MNFFKFLKENDVPLEIIYALIGIPISNFVDGLVEEIFLPEIEKRLGLKWEQNNKLHAFYKLLLNLVVTMILVYLIYLYLMNNSSLRR